jgi:putative oxidoreductase
LLLIILRSGTVFSRPEPFVKPLGTFRISPALNCDGTVGGAESGDSAMAHAQWTQPYQLSLPLNERVAAGRGIWLIGRLIIGGLFLMSGTEKLMGLDQFAASLVKHGISDSIAAVLAPVAAGAETVGGFCIALGLFTTWASLLMIAFTIIAAFVAHRFWEAQGQMVALQQAHFTKNMMIAAAFCLLYVAGGGPCSIDRWWRDRR